MDKQHIIELLKRKKRGTYIVIVNLYAAIIHSMPATIVQEMIEEDLSKEAGEVIKLNYFSLKKAITRLNKKSILKKVQEEIKEPDWKDTHELKEGQLVPGKFKLVKRSP